MSTNQSNTRSVETTFEINAPVEAVWAALTEAEEIARWFSPQAQVKPGVGGSIRWTWDREIDWESRIEIWETNCHLRAVYNREAMPTGSSATPAQLAMDFTLEAHGGKTTLRLVHSGFGRGADWEEEYTGVRRGWGYELESLRHYLENHLGTPRRVSWARIPIHVPEEEAWQKLMSPEALLREGKLENPAKGEPYKITAVTGDTFQGTVLLFAPPKEFGATVENMNNSLLRLAVEKCGPQLEAWVWLATYGLPQDEVNAFRDRWQKLLEKLLPHN